MKKNSFLFLGMLAMVLTFGIVAIGCVSTDNGGGGELLSGGGEPAEDNGGISGVEAVVKTGYGGPPIITLTWNAVGNVPNDQYKFYFRNEDTGQLDDFPVLSITEDQGKLSAGTTADDYKFGWQRGSNVSWGVSAGEDQDGNPIIVWSAVGTIGE
jgi:hypothetical protein